LLASQNKQVRSRRRPRKPRKARARQAEVRPVVKAIDDEHLVGAVAVDVAAEPVVVVLAVLAVMR
jgi:hypothetical protein